MDTITFQERLRDYAQQFKTWNEPIHEFRRSWHQKPMPERDDDAKYRQELEAFTQQQRANYDLPAFVSSFLDQHYEVYLGATPNECAIIRQSCGSNTEFEDFLMFSYVPHTVSNLQATNDQAWLLRGLVAMSLENCGVDYRDTLTALAELFVTSEQHGLDPKDAFQRIAALSSQERPRGGSTPVSEIMMKFENYAIVQERRKRGKS